MEVVREEVTKRMSMTTLLINREMIFNFKLENAKTAVNVFVHPISIISFPIFWLKDRLTLLFLWKISLKIGGRENIYDD